MVCSRKLITGHSSEYDDRRSVRSRDRPVAKKYPFSPGPRRLAKDRDAVAAAGTRGVYDEYSPELTSY